MQNSNTRSQAPRTEQELAQVSNALIPRGLPCRWPRSHPRLVILVLRWIDMSLAYCTIILFVFYRSGAVPLNRHCQLFSRR